MFPGKRARAVGGRVHLRPPEETFYEFTVYLLLTSLGREWCQTQREAPLDQKHPIWRWVESERELRKTEKPIALGPLGRFEFRTNGAVQCLATIAYDVYSLLSKLSLPEGLLKRLRHPQEFQGARYEISVAAVFARSGCKIAWEKDQSTKHCEFIATHPSGDKIGVEAKSRHKRGVLGHPGTFDQAAAMKADVSRLMRDAIDQGPQGIPFAIFIDVNCPATPGVPIFEKAWWGDLKEILDAFGTPSPEKPDPFNALCFTNFAYHYHAERVNHAGGEYVAAISRYSKHTMVYPDLLAKMVASLQSYGSIPNEGREAERQHLCMEFPI
jgi:hypothetical protein